MISCIILFLIGLANIGNFNDMITGLDFIRGEDYSVYFGEETIIGHWSWGLSIGFYLGLVATIISLVGSFMV
jgi:hypothetical protein